MALPSQFCYALREDVQPPQAAPAIKNGYPTFGTICRYEKINDDMLKIWKQILDRVPNAVLIMRAKEFSSNSTIDHAYNRMKNLGFNMDRVSFRPAVPNWLQAILQLDVILDAYPYVGGSTTFDALYMGIPVITFYGERRNTRFGLSILKQFGIEGLAVPITSPQDYIERAVGLVNDLGALDALHKNLRNMMKQAMTIRTRPYTKALEDVFVQFLNQKFKV